MKLSNSPEQQDYFFWTGSLNNTNPSFRVQTSWRKDGILIGIFSMHWYGYHIGLNITPNYNFIITESLVEITDKPGLIGLWYKVILLNE